MTSSFYVILAIKEKREAEDKQKSSSIVAPVFIRDERDQPEQPEQEDSPFGVFGGVRINKDKAAEGLGRILTAQAGTEKKEPPTFSPKPAGKPGMETDSKPLQFDATGRMLRAEEIKQNTPPLPERKPLESEFRPPILKGVDNDHVLQTIREEESTNEFLYKDTAKGGGKVTIGVGKMIPNIKEAKKLPLFTTDKNGIERRATDKEIEHAFKKVKAIDNSGGNKAISFDPSKKKGDTIAAKYDLDNLYLKEPAINQILEEHLRNDVRNLRNKFSDFDKTPPGAQQAILDMEFNMGRNKFTKEKWPSLFDAIEKQDWKKAAEQSHRIVTKNTAGMVRRNKNTRENFLKAYEEQKNQKQ